MKKPRTSAEEAAIAITEQMKQVKERRIDEAKTLATGILDRRSSGWFDAQERMDAEREREAKAAARRRRGDAKREAAQAHLTANRKVIATTGTTADGATAILDEFGGRFGFMVRRSGWSRDLAEACVRFEADYALAHGGIKAQAYDPRVDSSGGEGGLHGIEAADRLRRMEATMEPDEFGILVLWAGLGVTITVMHARGIGVKDELGRLLKAAATKAAAFYAHRPHSPRPSERSRKIRDLIREVGT